MADGMTGIERLRKLADDVIDYKVGSVLSCVRLREWEAMADARLSDALRGFASQIEREHAEELASAKRDLTDEARTAIAERLRATVGKPGSYGARMASALGVTGKSAWELGEEGYMFVVDRLCELIEHGGKRDVGVAALRELADKIDACASYLGHGGRADLACNMSDAAEDVFGIDEETSTADARVMLETIAERIRKAVEGAPKSGTVCECETHMQDDNSCVGECSLCERNGMVEWVEEHGGLEAVQERIDSFARMLNSVDSVVCGDEQYCFGERVDLGEADELFGAIYGELDKRLMPPGMEWLRYEDSEMVLPSDEGIIGIEYSRTGNTVLVTTNDDEPRAVFATGERVKRPEPEVLGADGEPIKAGETVYIDEEHADMAGMSAIASDEECGLDGTSFGDPLVVKRIDGCEARFDHPTGPWCPASWLTHTPPDTQERIDDDATRDPSAYCDEVLGWAADKIVLHSDYAAQNEAMIADLLRRQRLLDGAQK